MNELDLQEDIDRINRYLEITHEFEARLALIRLLEILRSWKASNPIKKVKVT